MKWQNLIVAVVAALAVGCNKGAESPAPKDPAVKGTASDESKGGALVVPESLKTAAYDYMGLSENKKLSYDITGVAGLPPASMTQRATLLGVNDGVATFTIERESTLSQFGDETIELSDKGASTVKIELGELDAPSLELPSDLTVGKAWKSGATITSPTQTLESKVDNKVVGQKQVTVKAGTFDCLIVESTLNIRATTPSSPTPQQSTTKTTSCYAKGVGIVKMTMKGPGTDVLMELTKIGD